MLHNKSLLWFYSPTFQRCCILVFSSHKVSVSDEKFLPLPTHPSDEPGQLKIYLPKKLLECLPKCSSLPKERHRWNTNEVRMRHTREGNIRVTDTISVFFAGDSSLANVTLRDEEEVNKHNGSCSLWYPKTVTPRNKKNKIKKQQP